MPEGHTIHRLAAQVGQLFVGRPWRVSSPQGRFQAGAATLDGRTPQRAQAWGKHLLVHVGPETWQVHLGLYGAFSFRGDDTFVGAATIGAPRSIAKRPDQDYDEHGWIVPEPPGGAVRARLRVPNGWADLRGPAKCQVLNPMQYESLISRLGPDPLRQPGHGVEEQLLEQFRRNLQRRRVGIGAALMDQAVIGGVGNIYRAESLFVESLDPDLPANELSRTQADSLWGTLTRQLRDGVREGTIITLREHDPLLGLRGADIADPRGGATSRSGAGVRRHWVYRHQGTPCLRCGSTLRMRDLQGRKLYWCPGCQR